MFLSALLAFLLVFFLFNQCLLLLALCWTGVASSAVCVVRLSLALSSLGDRDRIRGLGGRGLVLPGPKRKAALFGDAAGRNSCRRLLDWTVLSARRIFSPLR